MACKVPHSRVACWLVVVGQGDAGRIVLLVVVLLIMGLLVRAVDTRSPSFTPPPPPPNETLWIPLEGAAANQAQESRQGGRGGGEKTEYPQLATE